LQNAPIICTITTAKSLTARIPRRSFPLVGAGG